MQLIPANPTPEAVAGLVTQVEELSEIVAAFTPSTAVETKIVKKINRHIAEFWTMHQHLAKARTDEEHWRAGHYMMLHFGVELFYMVARRPAGR